MSTLGIIFSNIHNESIVELSRKRSTASIPFASKYRLIDFTLSNFVNAGVTKVGVLVNKNYQSLMDHLGTGRDWDLARKVGGLQVFAPFSSYRNDFLYDTRLEALQSIKSNIAKSTEEDVIITDCDSVNVVDYEDVLRFHHEKNADVTFVYKKLDAEKHLMNHMNLTIDETDRITKASLHCLSGQNLNVSLNIWVIKRELLISLLKEAMNNDGISFHKDVLFSHIKTLNMYAYEYNNVFFHLTNLENYYKANMDVLNKDVQEALFKNQNHTIYTRVQDSSPTKYLGVCSVKNSLLADGCVIEGTVENCILFRGVHIAKGAYVKNSIIMRNTIVGEDCELDHVITDKNVKIKPGNKLVGCDEIPFYIGKSKEIGN